MATPEAQLFRRRFRVPFAVFKLLRDRFAGSLHEGDRDAVGQETLPVDLKVLASLRILATGCSADAAEELSGVSEITIMKYHHRFCE